MGGGVFCQLGEVSGLGCAKFRLCVPQVRGSRWEAPGCDLEGLEARPKSEPAQVQIWRSWSEIVASRLYSAMSPAHLSATVPDKRLPTCWPSPQTLGHTLLYLGQCRGVAGRASPGQPGPEASENIHLCAERVPWVLTGAPFTWVTGVGQSGTWGAGRWGKMVLMRWRWHVTVMVRQAF